MHKKLMGLGFACLLVLLCCCFLIKPKPRVSIITSMFKGDEYIEEFLADIIKQTIFNQCELILINANSPGNEDTIIQKYTSKYPNIIYIKLSHDPGIYGVWNIGIKRARADFVTNANLDDKRNPACLEAHAKFLEEHPDIDLVFSDYIVTNHAHETFEKHTPWFITGPKEVGVSTQRIDQCGFGPQPMWRKSMHKKYGYFDENFLIAGDWEFAIRAQLNGSKFKHVPGVGGLYYNNPVGLSTATSNKRIERQNQEHEWIGQKYARAWHERFEK